MNQKLMSADAIASLFDRAAESGRPLDTVTTGGRTRWLRKIDFARPTKFTPDQENRLRRAHDGFARLAAAKLVAEHRIPIEMEIVDVAQLTWSDAHALADRQGMSAAVHAMPIDTKLLLSMDVSLLLCCIERLLGSPAETAPPIRPLTDIDTVLVRRIFEVFVEALSVTWEQLAEVQMSTLAVEAHAETHQLVGASEPTLALTMEARMHDVTANVLLLLPYVSVQPVSAAYSKRGDESQVADPDEADALRDGLSEVEITLRAEVGERRMRLRDVLTLQAGDVIGLGIPAEEALDLRAGAVALHKVRPGRSGRARAVQIVEQLELPR